MMKQIFIDDEDEKALEAHRAQRNAQVTKIRTDEEQLSEQKKLAYEAVFEIPQAQWSEAHRKALAADINRLDQELNGRNGG